MFLYACRYASSSEFSTEASLKYFILGHLAQLFYYLESVLYTCIGSIYFADVSLFKPPLQRSCDKCSTGTTRVIYRTWVHYDQFII
jgi:hypothetical protein